MREEIRRIHRQTKITTLYVTHDQKEALSLAGRMAILNEGRLDALGTPRELYRRPPTRFSAAFLGEINALAGKVLADGKVDTACGVIEVNPGAQASSLPSLDAGKMAALPGTQVTIFCRPESIFIAEESAQVPPPAGFQPLEARGRVLSGAFFGGNTLYEIALPGEVRWRVLRHEANGQGLPEGAPVKLAVDRRAWATI